MYESRSDYWPSYDQSSRVETRNRLKKIIINVNVMQINVFNLFTIDILGDMVKTFQLDYGGGESGIEFSRIVKVTEFDRNNEIIDNNIFNWSNENTTSFVAGYSGAPAGYSIAGVGDCNGDGKDDLMLVASNGWRRCLISDGSKFSDSISTQIGTGYASAIGDFNGDSKSDFAAYADNGHSYVLISSGNGFVGGYSGAPAGYSSIRQINRIFSISQI